MTPDIIQARNTALEIFEHLTIAQSSPVRFNDRLRDNKVEDAKFALMQLAAYLGFNLEPVTPCGDEPRYGNDPVERSLNRSDRLYDAMRSV